MEFLETSAFSKRVFQYLTDDEFRELQNYLRLSPEAGGVIPGAGGIRKLRWADSRRGKGTRSGLRVIYYHYTSEFQIWFIALYDKNEAKDLSAQQKKLMKTFITEELRAREARKWRKKPRTAR
jgi:hypothetical protein